MPSRQAVWQAKHRAAGLCIRDSAEVFSGGLCFRCVVSNMMSKYGLLGKAKKEKKAWDRWVAGLMSRYTRILTDEGFTLDSATAPEGVVKLAGFTWAKYKAKKQLLEIVGKFDDRAIRERFHRNL